MTAPDWLADAYTAERPVLWGLCYRMTGDASEAEDIVQETFARAIERPPADLDAPLRPWLTRVALNLGRDHLRKRKRRGYVGPWLPSPVETPEELPAVEPGGEGHISVDGRYDLLESVSMAFLVALEALTPKQRAVLLLRDVYDYSADEAADVLELSTANVRTTHHRARRALAAYDDEHRERATRDPRIVQTTLETTLATLLSGDVRAVERLLADSVHAHSDGGGEFFAARVPLFGRERVAKFYTNIATRRGENEELSVSLRLLNGAPAFLVELSGAPDKQAPRFVTMADVGHDGEVLALYSVLATAKLRAVPFPHHGAEIVPTLR